MRCSHEHMCAEYGNTMNWQKHENDASAKMWNRIYLKLPLKCAKCFDCQACTRAISSESERKTRKRFELYVNVFAFLFKQARMVKSWWNVFYKRCIFNRWNNHSRLFVTSIFIYMCRGRSCECLYVLYVICKYIPVYTRLQAFVRDFGFLFCLLYHKRDDWSSVFINVGAQRASHVKMLLPSHIWTSYYHF